MNTTLRADIDWVGHVDWTVRDFHGYDTQRGTSYNAYLVRDEKTALIDTVKAPYEQRLLGRVAELADLSRVDYVVCNHAEPDHSGALPRVMEAMPRATLVCNRKCEAALSKHYDTSSWKVRTVAEGDAIALGKRTLRFIETPMVHWPESMFTYVPQQKLLFSMDAFGQHYAASKRFDDEVSPSTLIEEAKAYYANIVMPYGRAVATCLEKVAPLGVEMIAPAHGLIWRSRVAEILSAYRAWSAGRPACKVVVIYDTMWESTARMAEAILEGASQPGVKTSLIHVRRSTLARIATTVLDAAGMAFGSSTLNREMMPMAAAVLTYLKGLGPAGKFAVAFGSYGWGRGGAEAVHRQLEAMQCELLGEPIRSQYRPTAEVLGQCRAAGRQLAEKAREMAGQNEVRGLDAEGPAAAQR